MVSRIAPKVPGLNAALPGAVTNGTGTLTPAHGGTGLTTLTAYAPICGGTTSTGAFQQPAIGSAYQPLVSAGAAALPSFKGISVLQRVGNVVTAQSNGSTTTPWDDTIPQSTEGIQVLSQAITPTTASTILVIEWLVYVDGATAARTITASLIQDSTANALVAGSSFIDTAARSINGFGRWIMTSGTTSSTTFTVRVGSSGTGTITFNGSASARKFGGVAGSYILITEYSS